MSFSYSGDPENSKTDEVRFSLGDTQEADFVLSNEEINFLLKQNEDSINPTIIAACRKIKAHFAHLCDESVGRVKITFSQKYKQFELLLEELIESNTRMNVRPYAGGISVSDKETRENNQDRVKPAFRTDLHCYNEPDNNPSLTENSPQLP